MIAKIAHFADHPERAGRLTATPSEPSPAGRPEPGSPANRDFAKIEYLNDLLCRRFPETAHYWGVLDPVRHKAPLSHMEFLSQLSSLAGSGPEAGRAARFFLEERRRKSLHRCCEIPSNMDLFLAKPFIPSLSLPPEERSGIAFILLRSLLDKINALVIGLQGAADPALFPSASEYARLSRELASLVRDPAESLIFHLAQGRNDQGQAVGACLRDQLFPALARLLDVLDGFILNNASSRSGEPMPACEDDYRWLLRNVAGSALDPEAAHQRGLEEAGRLAQAIRNAPGGGGRTADFRDILREAEEKFSQFFPPVSGLAMEWLPMPPALQGRIPHFFLPPSLDGKRGTRLYSSFSRQAGSGRLKVFVAHYIYPGHHFQLSRMTERHGANYAPFVTTQEGHHFR